MRSPTAAVINDEVVNNRTVKGRRSSTIAPTSRDPVAVRKRPGFAQIEPQDTTDRRRQARVPRLIEAVERFELGLAGGDRALQLRGIANRLGERLSHGAHVFAHLGPQQVVGESGRAEDDDEQHEHGEQDPQER